MEEEEEQQQQQQSQYEELKWTEAPLYYHNTTISHGEQDASDEEEENNSTMKRRHHHLSSSSLLLLPLTAETTALLVVDVQPEYWSQCPSVRQDFPNFPDRLQSVVETCRQRRAKIIWVRADYRRTHSPWLVQFERLRGKTPGFMMEVPCDPASKDFTVCWEDFATPVGGEVIIPKQSWSSTSDTALKEVLRVSRIDTVLVCGLLTSVCVQHSAFGVFEAGYRTLLVTDACADRGQARHNAALALYGDYMYELVTSQDLQHPTTGLLPAKPVWLTLHNNKVVCRNNSSSDTSVSPLNSFSDLQNALLSSADDNDKNDNNNNKGQGSSCSSSADDNEASSTAPSSSMTTMTSSSSSSASSGST